MITAVDTNVLFDVFDPDPHFGPASSAALRACQADGGLVACEVVWAETAAGFPASADANEAFHRLRVSFAPTDEATCLCAADRWRSYRRAGGSRSRLVADFLVGAHALVRADRLLTRDRGFYRRYFRGLEILDPSA